MGRAPCCDKANVKKGPWSPEEDAKLKSYIEKHGTGGNWIALPQKIGLKRCGKSCRLRWLNYLRPNIKHGGFSEEEDSMICSLYISIGSRWSIIAAQLPGRTDNDIKNYWNTRLKKKLLGKQRKEKNAVRRENRNSKAIVGGDQNNNINNNQIPYCPELPMVAPTPYSSSQEQSLNDHTSIRKLLIKLGGRFTNDHNAPNPINPQIFYEQPPMVDALNNPNCYQYASNGQYGNMDMLQGEKNGDILPHDDNDQLVVDGFEFLYCDDMMPMINYGNIGSSSMAYNSQVGSSNFVDQQEMVQDCSSFGVLGFN